ncbi:MAG TPA: PAS domain-containing protein [Flavitalea sp.]|nr:PAS domain-containing protein [Flavitalea sp.]
MYSQPRTYDDYCKELLEAQELADMGSYTWRLPDNSISGTPHFEKILNISGVISFEALMLNVHPSDRPGLRAAIDHALSVSGDYDFEFRYQPGPAEKVLWSRGKVSFKDDAAVSIHGVVMDITGRHHMLRKLQRSQELYTQAQAAAHVGNWSWEKASDKINWSDELYRIYGLAPQSEVITMERFMSFICEEDREFYEQNYQELLKEKKAQEYLSRITLDDGSMKILQVRREPLLDENGDIYKVIGTCQDITEKQLLIERLERSEQFIKHIADASPTVLYLFDARIGRIVYVNNEIENVLGYTPAEILEMGEKVIREIYHPDDFKRIAERFGKYKRGIKPEKLLFNVECRMKHKNGSWRWMLAREIVFSATADQYIMEVLGAVLDITDRKNIEEELFQKTIALQQSNTSLEEFAYVASHDLQEPLRKISTFGDRLLLKHRESLQEEGRAYLEKIVHSSMRMQQMINDLLSISTLSGDKEYSQHSLQRLLEEVLQTLECKLETSKAIVKTDGLPVANIVVSQFRQLFQNLVSNSLKFSRKDGTHPVINISHAILEQEEISRQILSNLAKASRYLQLTFTDNGIGFEEKFADKIFVIFQRLHSRSEYDGAGIGLAICKKIVENHGGVIFARSKLNEGASFTVIVPI